MDINTRDMAFVNFNELKDISFVNFNGETVYEAWKTLTKSGVLPLKIYSKGEDLINYKIYGNDYAVGNIGTNIFDGLLQYGDYSGGVNRISSVNYILVKPSTTYRFSRNNERVYQYDENYTQIYRTDTGNNGNTVETLSNCKYIRCVWFGTTEEDVNLTIWINEGTEKLEYEEYKYTIPIVVTNGVETNNVDIVINKALFENDYIDFKTQTIFKDDILSGITLPAIPTLKGECEIIINSDYQPSNAEVIYKGK